MGRGGHGDDEGTPYDQTLDELDFLRSACAAAQRGQLDKLAALLARRGAAAALGGGAVGGRGYTPLHYAAREGHLECARILLDAGACAACAAAAANHVASGLLLSCARRRRSGQRVHRRGRRHGAAPRSFHRPR